jgi:hypothetical protein
MSEKQMFHAVREWPPVIKALSDGDQIYLLRKGPLSKTPFEELQQNPVLVLPSNRKLSSDCFSPPAIQKYGELMEPKEGDTLTTSLALDLLDERVLTNSMHAFRLWDFHLYRADYLSERIHTRPEIELRLYQVRAHTLETPVELPASVLGTAYTNLIELPEPIEFKSAKEALSAPALKKQRRLVTEQLEA